MLQARCKQGFQGQNDLNTMQIAHLNSNTLQILYKDKRDFNSRRKRLKMMPNAFLSTKPLQILYK
jgi:hypothetical protein